MSMEKGMIKDSYSFINMDYCLDGDRVGVKMKGNKSKSKRK